MLLRKKHFQNIVGKEGNGGNQHFLLFPVFSTLSRTEIIIYVIFILLSANALNLDKVKFLSSGNGLNLHFTQHEPFYYTVNPLPNKPRFLRVCCTSLLKTLRENEKLLVTSNFSFSHSVFYQCRDLSAIFIKFETVVCILFEFGRVYNLSFGKGLNLF